MLTIEYASSMLLLEFTVIIVVIGIIMWLLWLRKGGTEWN